MGSFGPVRRIDDHLLALLSLEKNGGEKTGVSFFVEGHPPQGADSVHGPQDATGFFGRIRAGFPTPLE